MEYASYCWKLNCNKWKGNIKAISKIKKSGKCMNIYFLNPFPLYTQREKRLYSSRLFAYVCVCYFRLSIQNLICLQSWTFQAIQRKQSIICSSIAQEVTITVVIISNGKHWYHHNVQNPLRNCNRTFDTKVRRSNRNSNLSCCSDQKYSEQKLLKLNRE